MEALVTVCCHCGRSRNRKGEWHYETIHHIHPANRAYAICQDCLHIYYPEIIRALRQPSPSISLQFNKVAN